jgi:uncharacterized membrane protein HdeD (DUF308 family)
MPAVAVTEKIESFPWWVALSLILGVLLLFNPLVGATILPLVVGLLAVIFGVIVIIMAFKMRSQQ